MDSEQRFLFLAALLDGKVLLTVAVSFVTALLTTFAAPVIRYWLDNLRLKYRLRTEYEYEQRKRLRDLIGHYHGGILNAADIFKTRVFNLYLNEERGWLKVKERKEWFRRTGKDYRGSTRVNKDEKKGRGC
jgi:hypothetical protein